VRRWLAAAACVVLASAARPAGALSPGTAITQYGLDSWGARDGLPGSPITDITQTRDGYVWIASKGGVVRFDGVTFTALDLAGVPGLKRKLMWSCTPGRNGELWAGAEASGILRYKDGAASVLPAGDVWYGFIAVHEARDGTLWAANAAWGLVSFRDGAVASRTKIDLVRTIVDAPDGSLWVGTWGSGVLRLKDGQVTAFGREQGLDEPLVAKLVWSKEGTLWAGTRSGLFALHDGRFRKYTSADGLAHDDVKALLEDRDGNLWIGTGGGGLCRFRDGAFSTWRKADGMIDDQVLALHEDDEGGLWIGGRGTLARIRDTNFKVYTTGEGLRADTILQAAASQNGGVWISTYGGGLSRLKEKTLDTYDTHRGLPNDYVGAILEAADGNVWMGVGSNELVRLDRNGRLTRIDTGKRYVKSMAEDRQGLVVGLSRSGLYRVQGNTVVPFRTADGAAIEDKFIHTLHVGRDGTLWIGSNQSFASLRDGRLARFTARDGLSGADVYSVLDDPNGTLWLGTANGLERFKDGRGIRYDGQPLLSDNSVFTVLEDGSGNLWFNSSEGIVRVSKRELEEYAAGRSTHIEPHVFASEEGLRLAESTLPTVQRACRTGNGRMWFPTSLGLASVDPERLVTDHKVPPVLIEKIVVDGRSRPARDGDEIPAGAEKVEVHYTALSYTRPERATFRYMLEGFESGWVDAGSKRVAYYTKLPPGHFRFRVRAANSDGVWNDTGADLHLVQRPRFHQTVWFQLLCAVGVVFAVVSMDRYRLRRLERRERELATKVDEAVAQIKVLRGLLPICAQCKKIRNDEGLFIQIESYIREHSHAEFSHSICPDCMAKLYPEYLQKMSGSGS
jgi:ligand-binding sensor domain-containing protein